MTTIQRYLEWIESAVYNAHNIYPSNAMLMGCLHDPANVQQTSSKWIQNTRANAGRLLDRVNTV